MASATAAAPGDDVLRPHRIAVGFYDLHETTGLLTRTARFELDAAGEVTEERTVDFEGRQVTAAPAPSEKTPNYYPGGRVAGRPVPAGWYSEP